MTRDGEAELGAEVTLKSIPAPTQGRERQSLPTAEGHHAVSSPPTINTLSNLDEDAQMPPSSWTP